jgi:phage tail-like protein
MPGRHGPFRQMRYILEIDSVAKAGFSECTIPEANTEVIEYREGNEAPTVRKLSSLAAYGNITLKWGITTDSMELFEWWQLVEQGKTDAARRQIAVVLLDEEGQPGPRWEFRNAWCRQYDAPDLNATGNEVAVESMEIVHEGLERTA